MIQRRNIIVCLAMLAMFAFTAVADAGLLCGHLGKCGRRNRTVKVCVAECWTASGKKCVGKGLTCEAAQANAQANCSEPIVNCAYHWEIHRRGLFGRCRVVVCEVPVCPCGAAPAVDKAAAAMIQARCPTANGGSCYGYGTTCDAAIADAKSKCLKPITGRCTCSTVYKMKKHTSD